MATAFLHVEFSPLYLFQQEFFTYIFVSVIFHVREVLLIWIIHFAKTTQFWKWNRNKKKDERNGFHQFLLDRISLKKNIINHFGLRFSRLFVILLLFIYFTKWILPTKTKEKLFTKFPFNFFSQWFYHFWLKWSAGK